MDTAVLQRSLAILESMVLNSQDLYHKVAQEITIGQLIPHLQGWGGGRDQYELDLCSLICSAIIKASQTARKDDHCVVYNHISGSFSDSRTDQDIQTYTIAVINALFLKAPEEKRQVRLHCAHTALSHRAVHHFQDAVSLTRYIHMWSHQHFSTVTLYCVCVYVCVPESCVHSTSQIRL